MPDSKQKAVSVLGVAVGLGLFALVMWGIKFGVSFVNQSGFRL